MPKQYTQTGVQERVGGAGRTWGEWFSMWSNRFSFVPFIGGGLAFGAGLIGTALETIGQLFKGNIGSALTVATTGSAATAVNTIAGSSGYTWWANLGSGVLTGSSLGTHARKASEMVIGGVTGVLGMKPRVLDSHMAVIGALDNAYAQNMRGPGQFASQVAAQRGRDPREMYNAYRNGAGAEHVSQLEAARANGSSELGRV